MCSKLSRSISRHFYVEEDAVICVPINKDILWIVTIFNLLYCIWGLFITWGGILAQFIFKPFVGFSFSSQGIEYKWLYCSESHGLANLHLCVSQGFVDIGN